MALRAAVTPAAAPGPTAPSAPRAVRGSGRAKQGSEGWQAVPAACALALAVRRKESRGRSALRASPVPTNVFERSTLEAGAKLLEEAVKSQTSSPTEFTNFSEARNRRSFVSQQAAAETDANAVDADGLPLVYSVERIAKFWDTKPGELADRWSRFLRISTPFITRFFYSVLNNRLWEDEQDLARQAVNNLQELGPTFVKLGQVLSIRPDVLPEKTMKELARLQDNIETFSNEEAKAVIEEELGQSVEELFSSFSAEPIAAASLAQVYRATLKTGEEVAVKVQRPGALSTISKDLYVLRRLADVMQPLIRRFTADETDYIALTETFAEGLYTELDFRNEALNALRMEELLKESLEPEALDRIVIPGPLMSLTKRRVMLSKWVNGVKLSTLPQQEIRELISVGQEVFLTQLLDIGFFHGDPHPGNLLKITEGPDAGKLCLLDFGLVAQVPREDRELIISAVVHLGTQNWEALIADFQQLRFLAEDVDQAALVPILQRVLGPYLKGGGAQAFKNANFQALTQDLLKVNLEVKFSIPPYVSLLARSVATLEGVALQGDPQYQIVAMAYPFVVRRLLQNSNRRSFAALRELLYDPQTRRMRPQRLATLLQASLGVVAGASEGSRSGFIDFDAVPEEGAPAKDVVRFLLSPAARNLRPLLNAELTYGLDLVLRRTGRRLRTTLQDLLQPRLPLLGRLPALPAPPLLIPVPRNVGGSNAELFEKGLAVLPAEDIFEAVLPALGTSEDVDFGTFRDAFQGLGIDIGDIEQLVPDVLRAAMRTLLGNGEDAELAEALRQALGQESRETLANEVLASIAEELLRTWRARLAAMDAMQ